MNNSYFEEVKKRYEEIKILLPTSEVVPSILTSDPVVFESQMEVYSQIFESIEIDLLDNTLIKNQTLSLPESLKIANKYLTNTKCKLVLHFMSSNLNLEVIKSNLNIIKELTISSELVRNHSDIFDPLASFKLSNSKAIKVGIYFSPSVSIYNYWDEINMFDYVELMSVMPGIQGNVFKAEVLDNIPSLKEKQHEVIIDGGITPTSIKSLDPERLKSLKLANSVSIGSYFSEVFKITK